MKSSTQEVSLQYLSTINLPEIRNRLALLKSVPLTPTVQARMAELRRDADLFRDWQRQEAIAQQLQVALYRMLVTERRVREVLHVS